MTRLGILLAAVLAAIAAPLAAQEFPELTGRVVDAADILSDDEELQLTSKLEALENETQAQLVVATVPDLQDYPIEDFGYRLGRHWGIGDAERNDGVLLLVAPNERRVRIEVGYGLEGILTDAYSQQIIDGSIIPYFKQDDYPGGIAAGAERIIIQLSLPEEEALDRAAAAEGGSDIGDITFGIVLFVLFTFFPFLLLLLPIFIFSKLFPKRYKKWSDAAKKNRGSRIYTGGSSSFGGYSGGSSFSGGGGSFGGGGASGSW